MIPSPFDYERATSPEHAISLLGEHGDEAKLLAGGHSLLPLMRLRLAYPSFIVDISRLSELSFVRDTADAVVIGALTRHDDVQRNELLQRELPILCRAASEIGDPQVRNRGTIGGSLAHGDPAGDFPSVLLALEAELTVRGPDGERTVAARDFFKDVFEVDLSPQEMLTEVRVPKTSGAGWAYIKFAHRKQDWATVGVAVVAPQGNGVRVGLTSMGPTPLRATAVEEALATGADPSAAAEQADSGTSPVSDTLASAEYRKAMSKVLTRRALEQALSR
jgi:aerobic carbon-monoxide dehydrogenase medium subunit